jgi:hypothetical protein
VEERRRREKWRVEVKDEERDEAKKRNVGSTQDMAGGLLL